MRCPACNAEGPDGATTCAACGAALTPPGRRKPRRRGSGDEPDSPFSPYVEGPNRPTLRAYRLSVYGLVPGVGLILGPLALVLALRARRRAQADPAFTAQH